MNHICLIGAGALGIRHFEGLLKTSIPLSITVVDKNNDALSRARALSVPSTHAVSLTSDIPSSAIDCAIVATTSGARAAVVRDLLARASVRFMILEKILFTRTEDYESIGTILKEKNVSTWVNTSLRVMPVRRDMRERLRGNAFSIHFAGGNRHGLATNLVHYTDYACYLSGSNDFELDTKLLSPHVIDSKRAGYKELLGSVELRFQNGSWVLCTSLAHARSRRTIISSTYIRAIFDEATDTAHTAGHQSGWAWQAHPAPLTHQSAMTGPLVEEILSTGRCALPTYEESAKMHLRVLLPIRSFLSAKGHIFDVDFPFT